MKKYVLTGMFIICGLLAKSQADSDGCAKFKTGQFAYTDDSARTFVIKRTGRIQEETEQGKNIITRSRIRWISPCNYELKQLWSNSKVKRKNNGVVTSVIITHAGNDEYNYSCNCKNLAEDKKIKGTVYKLGAEQKRN
ncbi:MAG: hypothetical protein ABIW38_12400 [Ferruginibacter sp.]